QLAPSNNACFVGRLCRSRRQIVPALAAPHDQTNLAREEDDAAGARAEAERRRPRVYQSTSAYDMPVARCQIMPTAPMIDQLFDPAKGADWLANSVRYRRIECGGCQPVPSRTPARKNFCGSTGSPSIRVS